MRVSIMQKIEHNLPSNNKGFTEAIDLTHTWHKQHLHPWTLSKENQLMTPMFSERMPNI